MLRGDRWRCRDRHFTVVFVLASVCSDRNWRLRHPGSSSAHDVAERGYVFIANVKTVGAGNEARNFVFWSTVRAFMRTIFTVLIVMSFCTTSQAAERWEGIWAQTRHECADKE